MPRPIYIFIFAIAFAFSACSGGSYPSETAQTFAYPVSEKHFITQARDSKDEWYNALDFGEQNHLGEDWNKNSGGNTDCGEPVYAIADGLITYAADAPGPDGETSSSSPTSFPTEAASSHFTPTSTT